MTNMVQARTHAVTYVIYIFIILHLVPMRIDRFLVKYLLG
jgi:hypothetical protein